MNSGAGPPRAIQQRLKDPPSTASSMDIWRSVATATVQAYSDKAAGRNRGLLGSGLPPGLKQARQVLEPAGARQIAGALDRYGRGKNCGRL